jgi:nitroreductase
MSSYAEAIERRFGDGGPPGDGVEDNDFIRRVISRRTVRQYSDSVPSDSLLDLLVAGALSASAKSDFQQASILRVVDPAKRAAMGALFPAMPWIGVSPVFFVLEMRGDCSGSANCGKSLYKTARLKDFSMRRSMRRWRCRQ